MNGHIVYHYLPNVVVSIERGWVGEDGDEIRWYGTLRKNKSNPRKRTRKGEREKGENDEAEAKEI